MLNVSNAVFTCLKVMLFCKVMYRPYVIKLEGLNTTEAALLFSLFVRLIERLYKVILLLPH